MIPQNQFAGLNPLKLKENVIWAGTRFDQRDLVFRGLLLPVSFFQRDVAS